MFPLLPSCRISPSCVPLRSSPSLLRTCPSLLLVSPLLVNLVSDNPSIDCIVDSLLSFSIPPFYKFLFSAYILNLFSSNVRFLTNALVSLIISLVKSRQALPKILIISGSAIIFIFSK